MRSYRPCQWWALVLSDSFDACGGDTPGAVERASAQLEVKFTRGSASRPAVGTVCLNGRMRVKFLRQSLPGGLGVVKEWGAALLRAWNIQPFCQ